MSGFIFLEHQCEFHFALSSTRVLRRLMWKRKRSVQRRTQTSITWPRSLARRRLVERQGACHRGSPGDGTARALVSSQNDGGRTLLMSLSWAVNRSVDLDLIVRRCTLGSDFGLQCTGDAYLSQTQGKHFPFIRHYATHSWTRSSLNWATNKTNSSALSREFTTRFFAEMAPWIWSLWPSKAAQQDAVHRTCFITVSGI